MGGKGGGSRVDGGGGGEGAGGEGGGGEGGGDGSGGDEGKGGEGGGARVAVAMRAAVFLTMSNRSPVPMPKRRRSWGRVASPTHATKGYKRTDIQTHRQQNRQRDSCWRGSRIARIAARISRTACSLRSHCLCWLRSQSQQRARPGAQGLDVQ